MKNKMKKPPSQRAIHTIATRKTIITCNPNPWSEYIHQCNSSLHENAPVSSKISKMRQTNTRPTKHWKAVIFFFPIAVPVHGQLQKDMVRRDPQMSTHTNTCRNTGSSKPQNQQLKLTYDQTLPRPLHNPDRTQRLVVGTFAPHHTISNSHPAVVHGIDA